MVPLPVCQILPVRIQSAELPCGSSEPLTLSPAVQRIPLITLSTPGVIPAIPPLARVLSPAPLDFVVLSSFCFFPSI